ncbi:MAG: prepilin-type N-terminal cleavage/methylation domain-containing protein [Candidatus Pacebacteria bacterium]|nr:prepilin-type N-terminal cleavage/methylation domain-containing protein [Candidatus Paceibacterota bacterium]
MNKAFTLIELMVVTALIALVSILIMPNFRSGENQLAVKRETYKLSQNIRRVQEMAISAKEFEGAVPGGYGVYFKKTEPAHFIIFADIDNDKTYSSLDNVVEDVLLEEIEISSLSSGTKLTIVFTSPDPTVTITPSSESAAINLKRVGSEQDVSSVTINKVGLITID